MMPLLFFPFLLENNESNAYLVGCEETREVILVDAGSFDRAIVDMVRSENLKPIGIFITHQHYDHTEGLSQYQKEWNCPAFAAHPIPGIETRTVAEGNSLAIGNLTAQVYFTPGHTEDSVSLVVDDRLAFSGDALFAGSIGGTNSPERKQELLNQIRRVFLSIPEDVVIYPGHGPATTVGLERRTNPFLVAGA